MYEIYWKYIIKLENFEKAGENNILGTLTVIISTLDLKIEILVLLRKCPET